MSTNTKHNDLCKMAFGNPSQHSNCPRCEELKNGATPIKWNTKTKYKYYDGGVSKPCTSNNGIHSFNPGGYCNNCGAGRDNRSIKRNPKVKGLFAG